MKVKKRLKLKHSIIFKMIILLLFIVFISLFYITFKIYNNNRKVDYYNNDSKYGYIIIDKMSDSFATIANKELHFVKDKKKNLYVISIKNKDIKKYQEIIDWTYSKSIKKVNKKVYVYPIKNTDDLKVLAIKNINNFLTINERIDINESNYDKYLSKYYLDTDVKTTYKFNYIVFILFLIVILILLIIIKSIIKNKHNMTNNVN